MSESKNMNIIILIGIIIVIALVFLVLQFTAPMPQENKEAANKWNGTWDSKYFTLFFLQDSSSISGSYEPKDIQSRDPGILTGSLSGDKKVFSGIWTESGPLKLLLSSDGMSYTGTGGIRPDEKIDKSYSYTNNGTRIGSISDPANIWSGTWKTGRTNITLVQNGTSVKGSYLPFQIIDDEPGIFEGVSSEDGKAVTGKWTERGNFSFSLSEEGTFFNGTYWDRLGEQSASNSWNGTRLH